MSVFMLGSLRVVDLTKEIDPATETRRSVLRRFNTGGPIPDFHTDMDITSHLGTHCECPYHHDNAWPDVSALPLTTFMGRGVYVCLEGLDPKSYITRDVLDRALEEIVAEGDVVILDSPYRIPPFTPKTNTVEDKRLLINGESAQWMVDHKVKCVGFGDGVSIESSNEDVKPFHDICMAENIVFLEVLKNLELLESKIFFISYSALFSRRLDYCSVRVYVIEGWEEFR